MTCWAVCLLFAVLPLSGEVRIFPLKDVKAGMRGTGRTVFAGGRVEEFPVEILGIMENSGPKQSIILARLGGATIERTGVMQGMSGSPVYLDGRLAGAVALSFPFAKEPIAGIRPIEEMLRVTDNAPRLTAAVDPRRPDWASQLPRRGEFDAGPMRLTEIASPLWMSGFTRSTLEKFGPELRAAGLDPVQGMSSGRSPATVDKPRKLEPGEMITVELITGDLAMGADGTVTHVDGDAVYAFGHRFLMMGPTELPFARAEVMTLLSSVQSSFKIASPKEWLGTIMQDRSTAITGRLGQKARMLPVTLSVECGARRERYRMEMVQDRLLTPLLLQMAIFSGVEATERTTGAATVRVQGRVLLDGKRAPVRVDNIFASEMGASQSVAAGVAAPLAYLLAGNWPDLRVTGVELELTLDEQKKQLQVDSVVASKRTVRPGETIEFYVVLASDRGSEVARTISYPVPPGEPLGMLNITVTDALTANMNDYRSYLTTPPRTPEQTLSFLNGLRASTSAWLRVWRPHPSYMAGTETLPDPPPSLALMLNRTQTPSYAAKVAEFEIPGGGAMVTGTKTIAVEVKE